MDDGSTIDIGELVLDTDVYYNVTNNLTNCTNTNTTTQVAEGESYSATITAISGYELKSVSVTMGGTAVSVSDAVINITSVTGDIVITAVAEEATVTPSYTNVLPLSIDSDGDDYKGTNGEDGYKTGYKISVSSGNESAATACVSGFIKLPEGEQSEIRIKNITLSPSASINNFVFYNANKEIICGYYAGAGSAGAFHSDVTVTDGVYLFPTERWFPTDDTPVYFRFSCGEITDDTIVTINQEIINTETESSYTNIIPTLTDIDLTTIYNDIGYKENARISLSNISDSNPTGEKAQSDTTLLGIMPLGNDGDVLHLRGALFFDDSAYSGLIWYYDASGTVLNTTTIGINTMQELIGTDANGDATFTMTHSKMKLIDGAAYIRLNIANPTGELIMTRNQLIPKD